MAALIWGLLLLIGFYFVQRRIYHYFGMRGVRYSRTFSAHQLFAGQTLWMQETIANRKRLPLPWFRVESLLPAQLVFKNQDAHMSINRGDQLQNHASLFSVPSYTEIVRKHEVLCPERGCYRITSYTLSLSDFIGGISKSVAMPADEEIVVYPRLKEIRDFPLDARKYLHSVRSMTSPIMEDHYYVAGVRPYREGDSFRLVNWNATAKAGEMLMHKRESMRDNDLTVLLNAELLDAVHNRRISRDEFEDALSFAASAMQYIVSGGGKAGIIFNGTVQGETGMLYRTPAKSGTVHLHAVLEAMARFDAVTRLGLSFVLEQLVGERTRGLNYLLITAFLEPKQEALIRQLRGQGNTVEIMRLAREVTS